MLGLCQGMLPGWDVADDFYAVGGVEREGKGHACCDDHLGDDSGRRLRYLDCGAQSVSVH